MATVAIKSGTIATTFHNPMGIENISVRFVYAPLKICNHTRGQCSVSMRADIINMIYTIQKPTKEFMNEQLEGYFISINAIK